MEYYDEYAVNNAVHDFVVKAVSGPLMVILFLMLAISVVLIIAQWKIFEKAGEKGWKCLIPIYNLITLFKIIGISPWWLLLCLASFIPFIGSLALLGLTIYQSIMLGKAFNKSAGFIVGLILLSPIFYMILGFGSAEYVGNKNVKQAEQPMSQPMSQPEVQNQDNSNNNL